MLKTLGAVTALSVISFSTTLLSAPIANAQEDGCFIVLPGGQQRSLNRLCGGGTPARTAPSNPSASSPGAGSPQQAGVFQVPIKRRENGIPILDVTFNGSQTFEFMMDSGASDTVLPPHIAQSVGVVPEGTVMVNTVSDRGVPHVIGRVRSISVGGAQLANPMVIVSGPELEHGLLGQNFLERYDVTIKRDMVEFRERT
jgi:predicted aspartyl protease